MWFKGFDGFLIDGQSMAIFFFTLMNKSSILNLLWARMPRQILIGRVYIGVLTVFNYHER